MFMKIKNHSFFKRGQRVNIHFFYDYVFSGKYYIFSFGFDGGTLMDRRVKGTATKRFLKSEHTNGTMR